MSWLERKARGLRLLPVMALSVALAGCFQPLYGEHSPLTGTNAAGGNAAGALSAVNVKQIVAPNGTPLSRIAVEVRNDLLFNLTGGGAATPPTHELEIRLSASSLSTIVDINTARPDAQQYALDATYILRELGTRRAVATGQTFARVSYDTPGQQQRFVGARALRDAENRAAQVIADQIRNRLASYFVSGA
jgi:LPS-assembly lipoprotein